MKVSDAIQLIERGIGERKSNQRWADLGSGTGTFTRALASLLGEGSTIFAIDKESQKISPVVAPVDIQFIKLDFLQEPLPVSELDGILLANSLHYVKDKVSFLKNIQRHMNGGARMIIVEYDTGKANAWVPYPITFDQLKMTLALPGFGDVEKIGERNSIYRTDKIYACSYPKRA